MTALTGHIVGKKQSSLPQSILLTMAISSQGLTSRPVFMVHNKGFAGGLHVEEAPFGTNTDTPAMAEFWIYNREDPGSVAQMWKRYYEVPICLPFSIPNCPSKPNYPQTRPGCRPGAR